MKKIGILTYHYPINYGAYMQCFALSNRLKQEFPEATIEVIDYRHKKTRNYYIKYILYTGLKGLKNIYFQIKRHLIFKIAMKNLPLSPIKVVSNSTKGIFKKISKYKYDVLIVGSDAVFNWNKMGIPNVFFPEVHGIIKMYYAASVHGMEYESMTILQKEYTKNILRDFNYVGVRDNSSANFVKYVTDNTVVTHRVCDPTLLLDMVKLPTKQSLIDKYSLRKTNKKIMIIMLNNERIAEMVCKEFGNDFFIISLVNYSKFADMFIYDVTPFEWAKIFSTADITITEYFHGTLLSLKNTVPVIAIDSSNFNVPPYESKMHDLCMNRLGLPDFYYENAKKDDPYTKLINQIHFVMKNDYSSKIGEFINNENKSFEDFKEALSNLM